MFDHKVIINNDGTVVSVVLVVNNEVQGIEIQEGQELVPLGNFNDLIQPIYDGQQFVENAPQSILDQIEQQRIDELLRPSQEEIDKAKREMDTINLLIELEVI